MKILISQPAKQYTFRLASALINGKYNVVYATTFWYTKSKIPYKILNWIPDKLRNRIEPFLKRRYNAKLPDDIFIQIPFKEILRQIASKIFGKKEEDLVFWVERDFDNSVETYLKRIRPDVFIGYEKSCLDSMKYVKSYGGVTVLDLAQVHCNVIKELTQKFPIFQKSLPDKNFIYKINKVKLQEYDIADYILTLSSYSKKTLVNQGVPESKIKTISLGFDPVHFNPKTRYKKDGSLTCIFVGTLNYRKGLDLISIALNKLKNLDIHLTVIGSDIGGLSLLKSLPKEKYTHIPEILHEDLPKYYRDADLFLLPSYLDSWGMVVLESMACGTPVIVSENTGAKDVVKNGGGVVIEAGDALKLKDQIEYFYYNRGVIEEMGKIATHSVKKFTWSIYEQNVQNFINEITD